MTTPAETTASEVESLRATVVALDAEIARLNKKVRLLTLKIITCGVAASHPDPALSTRAKDYGGPWDSQQAEEVRALRRRALRYRARLARLCHAMSTIWIPTWVTSNTYGQVWSRTAQRPTPERSETP